MVGQRLTGTALPRLEKPRSSADIIVSVLSIKSLDSGNCGLFPEKIKLLRIIRGCCYWTFVSTVSIAQETRFFCDYKAFRKKKDVLEIVFQKHPAINPRHVSGRARDALKAGMNMKTLNSIVSRFLNEEAGLETVEYAVIAALITGAAIVAITAVGGKVAAKFNTLVTQLT
jgi:Flp pilus assembly pilin Flp